MRADENASKFGTLLTQAIKQIKVCEAKPIAVIQDEIGSLLGVSGRTVENWRGGHFPKKFQDRQKLAQLLIKRGCGQLNETWLQNFLKAAGIWDVGHLQDVGHPQAEMLADPRTLAEIPVHYPPFLEKRADNQQPPIFVGRQRPLSQLATLVQKSVAGQGQIAFIVGDAGRGKTALLSALAQQSMDEQPDLVVASGNCNAFSGIGDSFLPFRDVLNMLSGDVETRLTAGTIRLRQARRLWGTVLITCEALLLYGSTLLDLLIPQRDLVQRAQTAVLPNLTHLDQLQKLARNQKTSPDLKQAFLFQQITNVLRFVSQHHPLLILLDDLQWADSTSISLLFHLSQRLRGSPVCIVGAYRPEEVAFGRDGKRHPLTKVMTELKRQLGDIQIDLGQTDEAENRNFVDAYLDTELNDVDQTFRQALFERTSGHPLFTIELLRAMQARRNLVQAENGCWIITQKLNWRRLPARVEAVIAERLSRLEDEQRELLSVASVAGDTFAAQVVANVQKIDEHYVLRQLSQPLMRQHRLVQEQGEIEIGDTTLSRYRFAHVLFQRYLYNELSDGERRWLHSEVANALEAIYIEQVDEIAIPLAHHYELAHQSNRARRYLQMAGEQAFQRYANEEALNYFERALKLTPETAYLKRYDLYLALEKVLARQSNQQQRREVLRQLDKIVRRLDEDEKRAEIALRWADFAFIQADFERLIVAAELAVTSAQASASPILEAEGYLLWGHALVMTGPFDEAIEKFEQAIVLAKQENQKRMVARGTNSLGVVASKHGNIAKALRYFECAYQIFIQNDDDQNDDDLYIAKILSNLGFMAAMQRDFDTASNTLHKALRIFQKTGERRREGQVLSYLSQHYRFQGNYLKAKRYTEESLRALEDASAQRAIPYDLNNRALLSHLMGENKQALQYAQKSLNMSMEQGSQEAEAMSLCIIGHALTALGRFQEAFASYNRSITIRRQIKQYSFLMESLAGLAELHLRQNKSAEAVGLIDEIWTLLQEHTVQMAAEPYRIYLTCYRGLAANNDPRAQQILAQAYEKLQQTAANITNKRMRRSFLNNVTAVRALCQAYRQEATKVG